MKKIILAAALFLIAGYANAVVITVEYQATNSGYTDLSGEFSGDDLNSDGWLTFDELDDWYTNYDTGAVFSDLNDLGDFDYVNNIWVPNALQWNQTSEDAYMTWNNWGYSASTSNYNWVFVTTIDEVSVPEPAMLMLIGFGLVGFGYSRKRK